MNEEYKVCMSCNIVAQIRKVGIAIVSTSGATAWYDAAIC
jgi:hypothetical protein